MQLATSIFLNINLPNATTWFYFAGLLAVALFFKFSRLLSVRNWDVLTLFALMPGLLLLIESDGKNRWAFAWLLAGSGYFFLRCLLDLVLVRRPALSPNLNLAGLVWLAGALFVSLVAVAVRQPGQPPEGEKPTAPWTAWFGRGSPSCYPNRSPPRRRKFPCGWSAAWPWAVTWPSWSAWS